jgi:hypothetical protein
MRFPVLVMLPAVAAAFVAVSAAGAQSVSQAGAPNSTTLPSVIHRAPREMPSPIRPASAEDSAHRSGIVFAGPRRPTSAPAYIKIVPSTSQPRTASAHPGAPPNNPATR